MVVGLIFLALAIYGVALIWKPEFFYELTERWKHDGGGEPSKSYLLSTRFGGVMCVLAGIGGMICIFHDLHIYWYRNKHMSFNNDLK